MSFFNSLARAFGFGDSDDYTDDDAPSALVTPYHRPETTPVISPSDTPVQDVAKERDGEFPLEFFDSILDVFNNAQPDFIRECIDKDAQRRYLYGVLGASFKDYIVSCRGDIEKEYAERSSRERDKLMAEMASLKERLKNVEEKEGHLKEQRLSADRQKRALNDKVQELEKQVLTLEAEKEQYELENRSLMNKIKVSGVLEADNTDREGEIAELKTRLNQSNFINEQLKQEIEKLKKESAETAELYKSRMAMSDKMLSDIRNSNNQSSKEIEQRLAEKNELQRKYEQAVAENSRLSGELEEAQSVLDTADEVMKRMTELDAALKESSDRIRKLKDDNELLTGKISELEADKSRLSADIEAMVMERATTENELKQTIDELKQKTTASASEKPRRKRKPAVKISAIDETIDSTEWLVSTPPDNVPKIMPAVSDAEFGYQEPPKKSQPANDAQMSLF